jgi:hypothetical protein
MIKQKAFILEIDGEPPMVCESMKIAEELCIKWMRENGWYLGGSTFSNLCDYYDYEGYEGFCCHNVWRCYPVVYYK